MLHKTHCLSPLRLFCTLSAGSGQWTTDQLLRSRCRGTALHAKTREGGHTRIDFAGYSWVNLYFMVILQLLTIHHFHPPGWKHNRYLPPLSVGTTKLKFAALIKLWKYNRQPHRALRLNNTWGVRMAPALPSLTPSPCPSLLLPAHTLTFLRRGVNRTHIITSVPVSVKFLLLLCFKFKLKNIYVRFKGVKLQSIFNIFGQLEVPSGHIKCTCKVLFDSLINISLLLPDHFNSARTVRSK